LKLNLFKLRKNKNFRYSPRYSRSEEQSNIYEFDSAYSKNRESRSIYDKSNSWTEARLNSRNRRNSSFSKTILFIALLLTFVFLYVIDFDLSIFLP
jgi:hypothetical protein